VRKEQKAQVIDEIAAQLGEAAAVYAVDYRGLSVPQAAELRANLREHEATFRIVKNTLTLLAADKAGLEQIKELVADGPTALAFVQGDAALAAKTLDQFSRRADVLDVKGGLLEGRVLAADEIRSLARLPARDTLNAQFAGVVASPLTALVRGLGSLVSGLAVALGQVREQKEAAAGEASQPEAEEPQGQPAAESGDEKPAAGEERPERQDSDAEKEAQ
jgi:large subunit ribosomal protein L10